MNVKIDEKYNAVVLELKGKLMGGPFMQEMNETLHKFIDEGKKNVVIDLGGVSFVSSSGIGILISAYTTMKNNGGNLKIANISDKVKGLLSITKLDSIFEHYSEVDEALKSFE
ncbi:MAG: STAS domain-containing protein [Ignavibacteriaceae bacterium]|jgi:anti-sigma B factor antagonist